MMMISCLLT